MTFDPAEFRPYLDAIDATPEEKDEILQSLWRMMSAQADKAFGLDAVTLACGQDRGPRRTSVRTSFNAVKLTTVPPTHTISRAANDHAANDDAMEKNAVQGG